MACSCGLSNRKTFTDIFKNDGGSLPTLKYYHCKYQDQFESLFNQLGLVANESTLKLLSYAADTGSDLQGVIKNSKGEPIYFSVAETLNKIDASRPSNNFCSI